MLKFQGETARISDLFRFGFRELRGLRNAHSFNLKFLIQKHPLSILSRMKD